MKNFIIEIKWGFIFVGMTLTWLILEKLTGLYSENIQLHEMVSSFIAIPAILIYVLAFLDKRKFFYGGYMTYLQGLKCGVIISAVVTLISPITQYIATEWIGPDYFPNIIRYHVENGTMTQEVADKYYNLKSFIIQGLIGAPVMGIATSALVALFIRKKRN